MSRSAALQDDKEQYLKAEACYTVAGREMNVNAYVLFSFELFEDLKTYHTFYHIYFCKKMRKGTN